MIDLKVLAFERFSVFSKLWITVPSILRIIDLRSIVLLS